MKKLLFLVFILMNTCYLFGQTLQETLGDNLGNHVATKTLNMNNKNINYVNQLHFYQNVRFYDESNDSYLNFKYGDSGSGGIKFYDGNGTRQGTIYSDGNAGNPSFGLLDGDGNWAIRIRKDDYVSFLVNNSEKMRIKSNGYVGIGVTSPSYKLQVQGDIYANGGWLRVSGTRGIYFQSYGGGLYMQDNTWIRTYGNKSFYHNTGTMRTDGTLQVGPNGDRFIVKTDGKVGIGKTAPAYPLDVTGDIRNTGWLRVTGQKGLYSQSYSVYFYPVSSSYWRVRSDRGIQFYNRANTKRMGYIYHDNNKSFGFLDGDGNWSIRMEKDTDTRFYINNSEKMRIKSNGNVGIGVTSPSQKLHVNGNIRLANAGSYIQKVRGIYFTWHSSYGTNFNHGIFSTDNGSYSDDITLNSYGNVRINFDSNNNGTNKFTIGHHSTGNSNTLFTIHENGDVGIGVGTNPTGYKLAIDGNIIAEKVVVKVYGDWPDFVFAKNHELMTLKSVEEYINKNSSLPGVPSANEVSESGMDLGEMNKILLQKVEELTIYAIDQEKRMDKLNTEIESMKIIINRLNK